MERRVFIDQFGKAAIASLFPSALLSFDPVMATSHMGKSINFGIITDVHKDLMPDADRRLETFIKRTIELKVDFIIQLGDFCMAETANKKFLGIWERFKGPKYHVLGNHDMDRHSKQQMLDFWGMPKTYYSFDFGGFHFIVLDANFIYQDGKYIDYDKANFYIESSARTYINEEQIEWFKADLERTRLSTIIFSHQSLWHHLWGVKNRLSLQKILEAHKEKVICCMNGHNHIDFHRYVNGIDYIDINSSSYQWIGNDKYTSKDRFPKVEYERYKSLPNIAGYKDPLFAFASLNPEGILQIEGIESQWMEPSPYGLGMPKGIEGTVFTPAISNYHITFKS
ncbi:MAG: metallophosphoesterase [Bacteroidota bacterium]